MIPLTSSHNLVVQQLSVFANRLGASCLVEPSGLNIETGKRPDLLISLPHITLLVDVSICNPTAPSHIRTDFKKRLGTAIRRE